MTGAPALLRTQSLSRRFGGLLAVNQFSCEVFPSEIVGLIGPNGAGKSTVFNLISGFLRPSTGEVWFASTRITGRPAATIARLGLTRTFQHESFFRGLSVRDNVLIGATTIAHGAERDRAADEAINLFGLRAVSNELAVDLPHGYQRLLSMAIASATKPVLLCLDEPLTGLNQTELVAVLQTIRNLRESCGMSIHRRAQRAGGHDDLRPNCCAQPWQQAGGGIGRGGQPQPTGHRCLSGATRMSLIVRGLRVNYGAVDAVKGIDIELRSGTVTTVIGANGAGKTTIMKAVAGLLLQARGSVQFRGVELLGKPAHEIVGLGVALVPEGRRLFASMTVRENLMIGAYRRSDHVGIREDFERTLDYLPALRERLGQLAGSLSGGQQQMLAMGAR